MEIEDYNLSKLIPCRKIAFDNASDFKITLYGGKFHDLFAFYETIGTTLRRLNTNP